MRRTDYIRAIDAQISESIRVEDAARANLQTATARTQALRDVKDAVEKASRAAPKRRGTPKIAVDGVPSALRKTTTNATLPLQP